MKDVYELEGYELLYALLVNKYKVKDNLYYLYDMEYLWEAIRCKYDGGGLNRKQLFKKLYNSEAYRLLNVLLEELANNQEEEFFIGNIDAISDILANEIEMERKEYFDLALAAKKTHKSKINGKKATEIVFDILEEVDANDEWAKIYSDATFDGTIIYTNMLPKESFDRIINTLGLSKADNGVTIINKGTKEIICTLLKYEGTIKDVWLTMHEMGHYINTYLDKGDNNNLLREFPSIFYEKYAAEYLRRHGYGKELPAILLNRVTYNISNYNSFKDILYYLRLYLRDGIVDSDNDKEGSLNIAINNMVRSPNLLFDLYPYILDTYLANRTMDKYMNGDKTMLPMMHFVTNNLSNINNYLVFGTLDIDLGVDKSKTRIK